MSNYDGSLNPNDLNSNWTMSFNLIREESKVLDVGCSNGNFGEALKKLKNCVVDGIEPDKADAKLAAKKLDRVVVDTIENAFLGELKDKKYDHIVFLDVIEHLFDPVKVLSSLKRHLRTNGTVIFSIPNMAHISVRIMLMGGKFEYGKTGILDNTHMHFYTDEEIKRVFTEAGYSLTSFRGMLVPFSQELIRNELHKIGITQATESLLSVISSKNAMVFQYVGAASPSTKSNNVSERKLSSPNPKAVIAAWQDDREEVIESLKRQVEQKEEALARIYSSNSWKFTKPLRKVSFFAKRIINNGNNS